MDPVLIRWTFLDRVIDEGPMLRYQAEVILGLVGHHGATVDDEHPRRAKIVPMP